MPLSRGLVGTQDKQVLQTAHLSFVLVAINEGVFSSSALFRLYDRARITEQKASDAVGKLLSADPPLIRGEGLSSFTRNPRFLTRKGQSIDYYIANYELTPAGHALLQHAMLDAATRNDLQMCIRQFKSIKREADILATKIVFGGSEIILTADPTWKKNERSLLSVLLAVGNAPKGRSLTEITATLYKDRKGLRHRKREILKQLNALVSYGLIEAHGGRFQTSEFGLSEIDRVRTGESSNATFSYNLARATSQLTGQSVTDLLRPLHS